MNDLTYILESLLFVAEEPITVERFKNILETVEPKQIRSALHALAEQYESRGGGFGLYEVAGGWQLRSRPEYNEWIKRMLQPPAQRLTKATLETLAIVAYNQPIIRADIEHIRGVDCGGVLRQLLERKLIRVLGRKEIPGRPLIYATTKLFLELFDLKDLKDLPSPKEIEALTAAQEDENNGSDIHDVKELPHGPFDEMSSAANRQADSGQLATPIEPVRQADANNGMHIWVNPCQASSGAMARSHIDASPARISSGSSKISAAPARIPGKKAMTTAPDPALSSEGPASANKDTA